MPSAFYRPHSRVQLDTGDVMMTKQEHKAECDIHNILKQYQQTGIITHISNQQPIYADLPDALDYQSSLNILMSADEAFSTLPSQVRDHYDNDPAAFLAAFSDPSQEDQLRAWGLLKPSREPHEPTDPNPTPPPSNE